MNVNIDIDFYKKNQPIYCVLGLPRSMTAFMAAYLSTGIYPCLHEPEVYNPNPPIMFGSSSSGMLEFLDDLPSNVPIIAIKRKVSDVANSLSQFIKFDDKCFDLLSKWHYIMNNNLPDRCISYDFDHIGMTELESIWNHLNEGQLFDPDKASLFLSMNIQSRNFKL